MSPLRTMCNLIILTSLVILGSSSAQEQECFFLGAVYQHSFRLQPDQLDPLSVMRSNLDTFGTQTKIAAERGAQVIVFPERGITGLAWDSDQEIYYQQLPDPNAGSWNPCLTDTPTNETLVPYTLSCMASENTIMVVANFPTAESCAEYDGATCPSRGQFHFTTDVVFGPDGTLLARYHKMNLYGEPEFDVPPTTEDVVVDTPFGRFGVLTCFDLLWEQPTVELVERYQVDTLLFPTAWQDQLPFLTSVQAQSSFAIGLGVNILAANMFFPEAGFMGSGVYLAGVGPVVYTYSEDNDNGTLLVALLPCRLNRTTLIEEKVFNQARSSSSQPTKKEQQHLHHDEFENVRSVHRIKHEDLTEFVGAPLVEVAPRVPATVELCQDSLCCHANFTLYDTAPGSNDSGAYVLVVHRGNISEGDLYTYVAEVCSVLWCQSATELATCAQPDANVTVGLVDLTLSGLFTTSYVYPSVLTDELQLLPAYRWTHSLPQRDDTGDAFYAELLLKMPGGALPPVKTTSVTLYGRLYDEDY